MPVNIGLTFIIGGTLGWVVVKLLRPERHLGGLVIAMCSAGNSEFQDHSAVVVFLSPTVALRSGSPVVFRLTGNLGNLMLIVVPAICNESRSPFGETAVCRSRSLSYSSFSMAVKLQPATPQRPSFVLSDVI